MASSDVKKMHISKRDQALVAHTELFEACRHGTTMNKGRYVDNYLSMHASELSTSSARLCHLVIRCLSSSSRWHKSLTLDVLAIDRRVEHSCQKCNLFALLNHNSPATKFLPFLLRLTSPAPQPRTIIHCAHRPVRPFVLLVPCPCFTVCRVRKACLGGFCLSGRRNFYSNDVWYGGSAFTSFM